MLRCLLFVKLIIAGIIFPVSAVYAAGDTISGKVIGPGSNTCREFALTYEHSPGGHVHDDEPASAGLRTSDYIRWLQGYLSAYNLYQYAGEDITARTNMANILRFAYDWCSENPYADFISALPGIVEKIKPQ